MSYDMNLLLSSSSTRKVQTVYMHKFWTSDLSPIKKQLSKSQILNEWENGGTQNKRLHKKWKIVWSKVKDLQQYFWTVICVHDYCELHVNA